MRNVLIAHGKPKREKYEDPLVKKPHEANWLPWLKKQLINKGVETDIPALPKPYYPVFHDWREVFLEHTVEADTGLVGFSAGSEFLLRLLSEDTSIQAGHLVLVAPWRDTAEKYGDFSEYTLDPNIIERVGRLTIISSLDDSVDIKDNTKHLNEVYPGGELIELDGYGHFMIGNNMKSEEFPELLTVLLGD